MVQASDYKLRRAIGTLWPKDGVLILPIKDLDSPDKTGRKGQAIASGIPNITTIAKQYFPDMAPKPAEKPNFAFAFDIDGVLLRSKEPLPGSRETIHNLQKLKIPLIFLTNGGGSTEEEHAAKLSDRLGVDIDEAQFVQSHSPYRDLVPLYDNKRILVVGGTGNDIRNVAGAYGFKDVITSSDLFLEQPSIHPFPEVSAPYHNANGRRIPDIRTKEIAAILVWSTSREWTLDMQVMFDLLLSSGGVFGGKSDMAEDVALYNKDYLQDQRPKLYFCNPDLVWVTDHDRPRFAQGSFEAAFEGVWNRLTQGKAKLKYTTFGKPNKKTFEYGERHLKAYYEKLYGPQEKVDSKWPVKTVYMIGDNPEKRHNWRQLTGVYKAGTEPAHKPTYYAKDVAEAVQLALEKEGYSNIGRQGGLKEHNNIEGRSTKQGHSSRTVGIRMPSPTNNDGGGRNSRVLQDRTNTAGSIEAIAFHFGKLKLLGHETVKPLGNLEDLPNQFKESVPLHMS
ncbi:uncharacterized protein PG998_001361 [Apiospora kogelbergensis]|uniref:uncharacterized protein n=1 Tax=Apiospora kogelbergensis TaxID=1337665 RepID=UPI003130FFFD